MPRIQLGEIAYARSGDKGAASNIGVIAYTPAGFETLREILTAKAVAGFFKGLTPSRVQRFELPNLGALNFLLFDILDGGGSLSLRIDAQGKALGQALLEMEIEIGEDELKAARPGTPVA
ncbi:MAG TPA: hypothetical protein VIL86_18110 [Tepidisphaeraceae bacterium]|jgi:hypothetical protein